MILHDLHGLCCVGYAPMEVTSFFRGFNLAAGIRVELITVLLAPYAWVSIKCIAVLPTRHSD